MSLQKRSLNGVLPQDRERGVAYFQQRRVSLGELRRDGITATVEGSAGNVYEVDLDWTEAESDHVLFVACTCPRFADYAACKHVWATIIAFDQARFIEPVPGKGPLDVVIDLPWASRGPLEPPAFGPEIGQPLRRETRLMERFPELRDLLGPADPRDPEPELAARPRWRLQVESIRHAAAKVAAARPRPHDWRGRREAHYRLNIERSKSHGGLVVDLRKRQTGQSGELERPVALHLDREEPADVHCAVDRDVLGILRSLGPRLDAKPYTAPWNSVTGSAQAVIPAAFYDILLPRLSATGRFGWMSHDRGDLETLRELAWDPDPPWSLFLELQPDDEGWSLSGSLRRGPETRPLEEPLLLLSQGLVVFHDEIARLDAEAIFPWISFLRREGDLEIPEEELDGLLEELESFPELPELVTPPEARFEEVQGSPRPRLAVRSAAYRGAPQALEGDVIFDYGDSAVPARHPSSRFLDRENRRMVVRDPDAEDAAFRRLRELDARPPNLRAVEDCDVQWSEKTFLAATEALLAEGWAVEAEGARIRPAASLVLRVATEIDWFELAGEADFGGTALALPRLLAAVRRGERMVRLDDGSRGMLPAEWLERYGPLARLSDEANDGDTVRFLPTQAMLLDALLAAEPRVDVDREFARLRERLRSFERVEPVREPRGFRGELRGYQREGLGWLRFLQEFGFGGCLADDMGLGKTVQVLALLQSRRLGPGPRDERRPSLVVAPKSLVHNWIEEAERFTPRLEVLDYTGPKRHELLEEIPGVDLAVTTYGTLRRDIRQLMDIPFDYTVLDEAQAIKNAASQAAKASRLLRAEYRLALTGTPVENHLGELWSLFEFMNPGMLGRLKAWKRLTASRALASDLGPLSRALSPFILRRTKGEVLPDLPAKTEQTLYCELDRRQRKLYRELRDHYRASLDRRISKLGLERAKIHVLEALLRLRQAACHPGLLDERRADQKSAKLETLLGQLDEVLDEGHKALVFSQFTSLLALVKPVLDRRGWTYEYLDGRTRDRKRRIDRFQNDPDCRLFLISLKAGGLGLNLTAADYVFILDPWWNPAVEAQAVDRAHRIGQNRPVFAYRLISRDTVEEKILELQASKRELADAILEANRGMIRDLSEEDLRLLLS